MTMHQLSAQGQIGDSPTVEQWHVVKRCIKHALAISDSGGQRILRTTLANVNDLDDVVTEHLASLRNNPNIPTEKSTPVVAKVFETAELAEQIFSHLNDCDLLRVQQVHKYSKIVIESSANLRKRMFSDRKGKRLLQPHSVL